MRIFFAHQPCAMASFGAGVREFPGQWLSVAITGANPLAQMGGLPAHLSCHRHATVWPLRSILSI